jgi:Glycosyl transferase family 2
MSMLDEPMVASFAHPDGAADGIELSIVMPCLNEAETVAICVRKARTFLRLHGVQGEVLVADNGSTDGSQEIAEGAGARVVDIPERGYGSALIGGIEAARGRYVIMGDADDSYDLGALMPFLERLRAGADLVMGNRFRGGIAPGAMPPLHRYFGNPILSLIGRVFFGSKVRDFHCGLRGFCRDRLLQLGLQASGMEFASEVVVKATLAGYRVEEVPTTLSPDGRNRPPHLRSWRDGWRHLRFLLLFSPRWLFFYPGVAVATLGVIVGAAILPGPIFIDGVRFDVSTLVLVCALIIIGLQAVLFAIFTSIYASSEGFLPASTSVTRFLDGWTLERGLLVGTILGMAGLSGLIAAFVTWSLGFHGPLPYESVLRVVLPSITALVTSCQIILGGFFVSILTIRRSRHVLGEEPSSSLDLAAHGGRPQLTGSALIGPIDLDAIHEVSA